jgi:hypothetical protein
MRVKSFRQVLLPDALGPTMPSVSPASTANEISFKAHNDSSALGNVRRLSVLTSKSWNDREYLDRTRKHLDTSVTRMTAMWIPYSVRHPEQAGEPPTCGRLSSGSYWATKNIGDTAPAR